MGELLKVEGLTCGYDAAEVIRGVSFEVGEGEFLGIIGPNGSGKTTLFRSIAGLLPSWRGRVLFRGREITSLPPGERARDIAVLPQFVDVTFPFTVEEFVMMGRYPRIPRLGRPASADVRAVEAAMSVTGVLPLAGRRISEISGGERQRCLLAQGLAQEPRLLLLDEPTAHLDIGHQIEALDLIKGRNTEEGITVLIVLHDLNLASEYCGRIILLSSGSIRASGAPRDVLTYQTLEEVYKTIVLVSTNPISHSPHVLPIPGFLRRRTP